MANVLIINPATSGIVSYLKSVNTPDYYNRSDVLINPIIPDDISFKDMRYSQESGILFGISEEEKAAILSGQQLAERQARIDRINNFEIDTIDLAKALVRLNIVTAENLKTAIKQVKGF